MAQIAFAIKHLLFPGALLFASYVIGRRVLILFLEPEDFWEELSFSIMIGLGGIAYLVFFLGLAQALYRPVAAVSLLALAALSLATWPGLRSWRFDFERLKARLRCLAVEDLGLILVLVVVGVFTLALPLYPPTAWDSTEYHLAAAKIYSRSHGLPLTPYLRYPVFPQLNQMLFTLALRLSDDIATQLIQYGITLVTAVGLYALGRRFFSARAGVFAAALWLSNPLVLWTGSVAYIDAGLVFFLFFGAYAFLAYLQSRRDGWALVSGLAFGFAAATKYPALFWALLCGMGLLAVAIRKKKWKPLVLFALAGLAAGCPFYLRNLYYSGNPFFPYLGAFFSDRLWTAADFASQAQEQGLYGLPRTAFNLISLPWHLIFNPEIFASELQNASSFHPLYLFLMPVSLFQAVRRKYLGILWGLIASFTIFWFITPQVLRYLLPVLPLLSLATAAALGWMLEKFSLAVLGRSAGPLMGRTLRWGMAGLCAGLILLPGLRFSVVSAIQHGPVPVTRKQRNQYLALRLPSYPAYRLLSQVSGSDYVLYALYDANMAYFADGVFMGDWFGPARYVRVLDKLSGGQALFDELRNLGAGYFLVSEQRWKVSLPKDAFFKKHFKTIYQQNGVSVYRLVPAR